MALNQFWSPYGVTFLFSLRSWYFNSYSDRFLTSDCAQNIKLVRWTKLWITPWRTPDKLLTWFQKDSLRFDVKFVAKNYFFEIRSKKIYIFIFLLRSAFYSLYLHVWSHRMIKIQNWAKNEFLRQTSMVTEATHQISALALSSFFLWAGTKFRSAILRCPWWSYRETFVRFAHYLRTGLQNQNLFLFPLLNCNLSAK